MHRLNRTVAQALPVAVGFALGRIYQQRQTTHTRVQEIHSPPSARLASQSHTSMRQTQRQAPPLPASMPSTPFPAASRSPSALLQQLKAELTPEQITTDPEDIQLYGQDATPHNHPAPLAILFPRTIEEVQTVMKLAQQYKIGVVPSGGRTGLSGGAVALSGELVLCLDEMDAIIDVNQHDRTVTCQAGVTTQTLQSFAKDQGLYYPVSFASQGASQIGGNIATNAGGVHVIQWGNTREQVIGLKVVTPEGALLELDRNLTKDNTGYDLKQLYIGSEGTLGIIVEATMKLTSIPSHMRVTLLGIHDIQHVSAIKQALQSAFNVTALELISSAALQHVHHDIDLSRFSTHPSPSAPLPPYFLLTECADIKDKQAEKLDQLLKKQEASGLFTHHISTTDPLLSEKIWALREGISSSLAEFKPLKFDISVQPSKITQFIEALTEIIEQHGNEALRDHVQFVWFGHIGDGNVHLNFIPTKATEANDTTLPEKNQLEKKLTHILFSLVKKYNGSISAEHGLGILKKPYINYTRKAEEVAIMNKIKSALDPNGLMNPGKMLDKKH